MFNKLSLTVILVEDPTSKGYTAFFAQLPTIIAEGDTEDEATNNLMRLTGEVFEYRKNEELNSDAINSPTVHFKTRSIDFKVTV